LGSFVGTQVSTWAVRLESLRGKVKEKNLDFRKGGKTAENKKGETRLF